MKMFHVKHLLALTIRFMNKSLNFRKIEFSAYLPIQNRLKIVSRISGLTVSPVISDSDASADFKSMDIDKYKIAISTFNYSIPSNVYGNFELRLPQGFGYFENDTILKGHFECNNWEISSKEELKSWKIKEWFKNRNNY